LLFDELLAFVDKHPNVREIRDHLRRLKATSLTEDLRYVGPRSQQTGHRAYDDLIVQCFHQVIRATSREALLKSFMDEFDRLGAQSPARCLFVLEEHAGENAEEPLQLAGLEQRRILPARWSNYCRDVLPRHAESPLLRSVLRKRAPVELWYNHYVLQYQGEFDALFYTPEERRPGVEETGYWISGVSLPSGGVGHPHRALFVLYPNLGTDQKPGIAGGANQEWRALHFLALAYQVLNHQLAGVAEQVHARRQELLTTLAPGILHHEIGLQVSIVRQLVSDQNHLVRRVYRHGPKEEMDLLANSVANLIDAFVRLSSVTNAFNNLERRQAMERFAILDVVEEAYTVTYNRLGNAGVDIEWSDRELSMEIESDAALLLHLLVNIVINAIHAFGQYTDDNPGPRERLIMVRAFQVTAAERDGLPVRVDLLNNGPPIPEPDLERIFEKGFTTRKEGHGHGLHICRLIAQYLGGRLRALGRSERAEGVGTVFRLELPLSMPRLADLESDRR
jgi:signal transduction histidine kinase